MEVKATNFEGLFVLKPKVFSDERGYFFESFNSEKFTQLTGITANFVQDNQSLSQKGVLRGLHFQRPPYAQAKLVRVITGAVLDVVVDIRKNAPTYGQHFAIELSDQNHYQLYIPEGFAHGFLTLRDKTIFSYKCSAYYHPQSEGALLWSDNILGIDWGENQPLVSEKDQKAVSFHSFQTPFQL